MVNLYVGYRIENDTTISKFVFQPMIIDGPYLLMKMIAESMGI